MEEGAMAALDEDLERVASEERWSLCTNETMNLTLRTEDEEMEVMYDV